jgi:hypothetical protein
VSHEQFAFLRQVPGQSVLVAVNAAAEAVALELKTPPGEGSEWVDVLNAGERFTVQGGTMNLDVPACWARVLTA